MPRNEWLKQGVNILHSLTKTSSTYLARINVSDCMEVSVQKDKMKTKLIEQSSPITKLPYHKPVIKCVYICIFAMDKLLLKAMFICALML
jgi:hypothetical protein